MPAKVNSSQTVNNGPQRVAATEMSSIVVPIEADPAGEIDFHLLHPTDSGIWPILSQKSRMYSSYDIAGVTVTFTPTAGTNVNGTLIFGFSKDLKLAEDGGVFNMQQVSDLPVSSTMSLSAPKSLYIASAYFNNRGNSLLMDASAASSGNSSLYYPGVFFYGTSGVSVSAGALPDTLGFLKFTYNVMLKDPHVDIQSTESFLTATTTACTVVQGGLFSPRVDQTDTLVFTYHPRGTSLVWHKRLTSDATIGLTIVPTPTVLGHSLISDGTATHSWDLYVVPYSASVEVEVDTPTDVSAMLIQTPGLKPGMADFWLTE